MSRGKHSKLYDKISSKEYLSVEELSKDIVQLPRQRITGSLIKNILKNSELIAKQLEGKDINICDLKYLFINNLPIEEVKCPVCGKVMHTKNLVQGYNKTCSPSCGAKFSKQKSIKTCLERYGVEHTSQIKESREKFKQTCLEKFGGTAPLKNKAIKEKMQATNLERYGAKSTLNKGTSVRTAINNTNLEKYGSVSPLSSEEVKEKIKKTNLERYGSENVGSNEIIKEKIRNTTFERYGTDCSFKAAEVKEKIKKTNLEKYGSENPFGSEMIRKEITKKLLDTSYSNLFKLEEIEPTFSREEWFGHNKCEKNSIEYKWKCKKCGNEFIDKINGGNLPRCLNCHPYEISLTQEEILNFIKTLYSGTIITNDRNQLNGKEIDIWIPELKLGIEFNGNYWHANKPANYHINKTKLAESKGIHLIQIFEHEWFNKKQIIKHRIKNFFGTGEKIQARKCIIKEITSAERKEFLNNYHLQGDCKASVNIGLFYNNELVSVMSFGKPRFNKKYEWELLRFASSKSITGGSFKLLKYFERKWNPKSLLSYADRKWSSSLSNVYQRLGFNKIGETEPGYFYTKGKIILSRFDAQKKKLKSILGDRFFEDLSESDNMFINGYLKLFDCGNLVFEKIYSI